MKDENNIKCHSLMYYCIYAGTCKNLMGIDNKRVCNLGKNKCDFVIPKREIIYSYRRGVAFRA